MTYVRMADAAFAQNIPPGFDIAAGYYGGPLAYHVWPASDWQRFPGRRLLIWVAGYDGAAEGVQAAEALAQLGVPDNSITAVDMETRRDRTMLEKFGKTLDEAKGTHAETLEGFALAGAGHWLSWVYGSRSTVFGNPQLNGYWVADYTNSMSVVDGLLATHGVRAVQFAANLAPGYDASLVKAWTEGEMWHG